MKRQLCGTALVTFGIASLCVAQSNTAARSEDQSRYSAQELRQLVHEAHSPQQYHLLATYYGQQQVSYEAKAVKEKQEWDRRSANVTGPAAKGFRPVDASRNRYQYFTYKADEASTFASRYQQLEQVSQLASSH